MGNGTAKLVILAALCMLAHPAFAQKNIITTQKLCQELVPHVADKDVEYQPGVDAKGRAVVPADLNDNPPVTLPETIYMSITLDQAQQLNLPVNNRYTPQAFIGEVSVEKDGTVYFNRKRVSQPQLQVLCQDQKKN